MPEPDFADELPPLPHEVQRYVDAFAAEERPAPGQRAASWAVIEQQVARGRRRVIGLGVAGVLAAAAAVVLLLSGVRGSILSRRAEAPSVQVPWEGSARESGGEVSRPGSARSGRHPDERAAGSPDAPEPDEPAEPVDSSALGSPGAVDPASEASDPRRSSAGEAPERPAVRPRAPAKSSPPSSDGTEPVPAEAEASSLAEELALFRRAKLALLEGSAAQALSLLDEHRERFPRGALRREGTVLRAEALCALGRTAEATRLRDRFLGQHASSPLATRMRSVCR